MALLRLRTQLVLAALLFYPVVTAADEAPEEAPVPRPVPAVVPPQPLLPLVGLQPPVPPEFGRRSVWQFYGVDRYGRFRPLVVQTPYGAYYRYNGAPFPWANVHSGFTAPHVTTTSSYMPYAVD